MPGFLLTILLIGIGWFLLIRPQQAKLKERKALIAAIEVGDEVITAGGIHGRITEVQPETVQIAVADGVELTLARQAIARRLEDETQVKDETPVNHAQEADA